MGDQHDLLVGLDAVPWHRIVHFYGRASDIPRAIRALGDPGREEAIRHLRRCLQHQDGVIQATPFAVRFILRLRDKDPEGVRAIAAAAKFVLARYTGPLPDVEWDSLLSEHSLWPEFSSEPDDEIRWEEWVGWSILTLREIARAAPSPGI
jgi:hypothetical protein